ncbi:MAG: hypothetical protein JJ855_05275 [Rhodospirillales bacterium]|nr:hypothetical protein [Rhodospirillales bacterium]
MSGRANTYPVILSAALLAPLLLGACGSDDKSSIIAASPTAITIQTIRFTEPADTAEAHCAKHGRKAVARGNVKLGAVGYKTMWGYDCVDK